MPTEVVYVEAEVLKTRLVNECFLKDMKLLKVDRTCASKASVVGNVCLKCFLVLVLVIPIYRFEQLTNDSVFRVILNLGLWQCCIFLLET